MNKELINKYKKEFNHWLKEGSVLINSDLGWCPITTEFAWGCNISVDALLVINDEYVEFRKALAEGKIIQIYDAIYQHEYDPSLDRFGWRDFKSFTASSSFSKTPDLYRIKPDESKFKVGDFVRYIHTTYPRALEINNINGGRYYFINSEMSCLEHELEPWTPIKGEWCWFYDKASNGYSCLGQFKEYNGRCFISTTGTSWNFCEPFLNSLPSYLKDK